MNFKEKLKLSLGEDVVKDDEETLLRYSKDSSDHPPILPSVVILPRNLNDVIRAVEILYSERIPITPRGSGTSLTGGSIPSEGGAVISPERMNKIKEIDEENLTATVEPGVITGDLINEVEKFNLFYPPDPASLQSCTIGGNVAENAGGPRAFKYGTTKNYVLEIEAVIKNGERIRIGKKTKKWVVGYDLPSLFVGSEGTFGIITEITLRLIPKPPRFYTLLVAFGDGVKAGKAVSEMIKSSLFPNAIEFVDGKCISAVGEKIAPFLPKDTEAFLLVEFDGFGPEFERQVEIAYEIFQKNSAWEVFVAEDEGTRSRLWSARRGVLPSLESLGKLIRHEDVVVPRSKIPDLIAYTEEIERNTGLKVASFGHAADGNIHVNILYEEDQKEIMERAVDMVIEKVWELGGTASGEHGIGLIKKKHLLLEQGEALVRLQREIKGVFDPKNLFNPDKVFP